MVETKTTVKTVTLESEINLFANALPYWAKSLSKKLLSSETISDDNIDTSYSYLLEDAGLRTKTARPELNIDYIGEQLTSYKMDLRLSKLHSVEGVNALVENQIIEFSPNFTVIYGVNGSGKSGYVRMLKKAFFNRTDEPIIPNVHIDSGHKSPKAEFVFVSGEADYPLTFPDKSSNAEFHQFSVFDSKSIPVHLNNKNEFEFRPAGLNFFAELTEVFRRVEEKINQDINAKNISMDYASFFDGESEIKALLSKVTANTKIDELKKHLPFSVTDKDRRKKLEEQKAQLQALKKDKEIEELEEKKKLIESLCQHIENNNKFFTTDYLNKIRSAIDDYKVKDVTSKRDGMD
ncbi:MAG: ATP-binding protein [Deltaproteobacteria bacterium]